MKIQEPAGRTGDAKRYLIVAALLVVVGVVAAVAVNDRTGGGGTPPLTTRGITRGVYVVSGTTGSVIKIDPETRRVTETIQLGASYLSTIAVAGEYLYYASSDGSSSYLSVGRYNLFTQENEPTYMEQQFNGAALRVSPTDPEILFVGETGLSPANIQKWSVPAGGDDPSLLAQTEHGPMGGA